MAITKLELETVELEKFRYAVQMRIAKQLVGDLSAENLRDALTVLEDYVTDSLVLQLRLFLRGRAVEELCYQHPADWKEAVKEALYNHLFWFAFLNRWRDALKAKSPVRYTYLKWTARELYPKVAFPEQHPIIRLVKEQQARPFEDREDA